MSSAVMENPVGQLTDESVILADGFKINSDGSKINSDDSKINSGDSKVNLGAAGGRSRGPLVWLASIVAWVLAPPKRGQRGITTIEYIFGAILAIAIVTVVVTVIRNPAVGEMMLKLIEWALKFRGK